MKRRAERRRGRLRALRLACAALLACAGSAASGPAAAQEPGRDVAREFFRTGVAAYQRGDFNAALLSFESAYRVAPHPSVRVNIANCHVQLRRYTDALTDFELYLAESPTLAAPQRADIERQMNELRRLVAELRVRIGPASAPNPVVTIDGAPVGLRDVLRMTPGRHVLAVSAAGFVTERTEVTMAAGEQRAWEVELRLEGAEPARVPAPGEANPGGAAQPGPGVTPIAAGPAAPVEPPAGPVTPPRRRLLTTPVLVGIGATSVLTVTTIALGASALGALGAFDAAAARIAAGQGTFADERARGQAAASQARGLAVAADVTLGLTLAAAAGTAVAFVLTRPPRGPSAGAAIAPWVHHGSVGFSFGGHF